MWAFPRFPRKYTFDDGPKASRREKQQHTSHPLRQQQAGRAGQRRCSLSFQQHIDAGTHMHTYTNTHTCTYTHTHTHMNAPSNSVRLICFGYSIIFLVEYLKNQIKLCIRYTNNAPLPPHGCCETLINVCKVLSDPQKKGTIEVCSLIISQHTKVEVKRSSLLLIHKTTDLNSCIKKPPRC